jgi:hypothetical protein
MATDSFLKEQRWEIGRSKRQTQEGSNGSGGEREIYPGMPNPSQGTEKRLALPKRLGGRRPAEDLPACLTARREVVGMPGLFLYRKA